MPHHSAIIHNYYWPETGCTCALLQGDFNFENDSSPKKFVVVLENTSILPPNKRDHVQPHNVKIPVNSHTGISFPLHSRSICKNVEQVKCTTIPPAILVPKWPISETTQQPGMRIPVLSLRPYFVFQSRFQSYNINQQNSPSLNLNLILKRSILLVYTIRLYYNARCKKHKFLSLCHICLFTIQRHSNVCRPLYDVTSTADVRDKWNGSTSRKR